MKFTPNAIAALSKVLAKGIQSLVPLAAAMSEIGVTEIRLLIIGIPNSVSISSPTLTK